MASAYQRLGQQDESDAPLLSRLDIDDSESLGVHYNRREKYDPKHATRWWYARFFGLAVLTGIGLQALIWSAAGAGGSPKEASVSVAAEGCEPILSVAVPKVANVTHDKAQEDRWPLEKVREMVGRTKGYYARDYSLNLGWNNVSLSND